MEKEFETVETEETEIIEHEEDTPKTYTEEEVQAMVQRETDRRITQALKTQQKKFEKKIKLSQLDDDAREKAEKDTKIEELEEKLKLYEIEKNKSELKSVLGARGLSAEFADIITITDDLVAAQANIEKLDKLFKDAVTAEVTKRIGGKTPKGATETKKEVSKDDIKKMSLAQLTELKSTNPELYKQFFE